VSGGVLPLLAFLQADFGYLRERLDEMKSRELCKPRRKSTGFLRCTK